MRHRDRSAPRLPRALVFVAAALLVGAIYHAAMRGLADARYVSARHAMAQWPQTGTPPGPAAWRAVREALQAARAREPDNPLFVEELGRLHELRARGLDPRQPVVHEFLAHALEEFRAAARMRPASPTTWANIALLKFRLDTLDAEFYAAAEHAARLGPWEPGVQRRLSEIGLAAWSRLTPAGRELAAAAVERGLQMQPRALERVLRAGAERRGFCADVSARAPRTALACARLQ